MATSNSITWGKVTERAERVAIVAAGPSVKAIPLSVFRELHDHGIYILSVNNTALWLPRINGWFTLDPSHYNRKIMSRRPHRKAVYYAAVPPDYGSKDAAWKGHRDRAEPGIIYLERLTGSGPAQSRYGLSFFEDSIHTGNSAYGALNVAFNMRPKKIALFGIDGTKEAYAYSGGYPQFNFDHLPDLFASALPMLHTRGIMVRNGSPNSILTCFQRTECIDAAQWLQH